MSQKKYVATTKSPESSRASVREYGNSTTHNVQKSSLPASVQKELNKKK